MKFESKFGIGEIVETNHDCHKMLSELFKVMDVLFGKNKSVIYVCRGYKGQLFHFHEIELFGDPAFDQEKGCYPPEILGEIVDSDQKDE